MTGCNAAGRCRSARLGSIVHSGRSAAARPVCWRKRLTRKRTSSPLRGSWRTYARSTLPVCSRESLRSSASRETNACSRSAAATGGASTRSEEHTSELQSRPHLVCRLLLEKKKKQDIEISLTQRKKKKT